MKMPVNGIDFIRGLSLVWFLWLSVPVVDAATSLASTNFYSSPGNALGVCNISTCSNSGCAPNQYLAGCGPVSAGLWSNSSGACATCTNTPASGYYYSAAAPVGSSTCSTAQCTQCSAGSINVGCGVGNPGACSTCVVLNGAPPAGKYYNTSTGSCVSTDQTICSVGYYNNPAPSATYPGNCVTCGVVPPLSYWVTPTTASYTCQFLSWTVCSAGYYTTGYSAIAAGSCAACPVSNGVYYIANTNATSYCPSNKCANDCPVGQYRAGCTGTNPGQCAPCTAANGTQEYATNGNLTDSCQVVACTLTCPVGFYIAGCGNTTATLYCAQCTIPASGTSYFTGSGLYTPASCPTAACQTCSSNGYYLNGCYNTSVGTFVQCTN